MTEDVGLHRSLPSLVEIDRFWNESFFKKRLQNMTVYVIIEGKMRCYSQYSLKENNMNAIITVVGHDSKGIIAKVSAKCAESGANIVEISQSVLKEYFAMIMVIDISDIKLPFTAFVDEMKKLGDESNLDIRTMHEDIFNSMHRI